MQNKNLLQLKLDIRQQLKSNGQYQIRMKEFNPSIRNKIKIMQAGIRVSEPKKKEEGEKCLKRF